MSRAVHPDRLDAVYAAIIAYKSATAGRSPTVREITARVGFSSTSITHLHLRRLARDGRVVLGDGYRSIALPGERWLPPAGIGLGPTGES